MDQKELAGKVARSIREYVARVLVQLEARLKVVESRPAVVRELTVDERKALVAELLPHVESFNAKAALEFERNANDLMLKAVAAIPEPAAGRDGFGFEDLSVDYDGERTVTLKFQRGDVVKEFPLVLPIVLDRGFWKDGTEYHKGDSVTFGGSAWIAQSSAKSKPEIGNPDWRLSVRKGRDAKTPARLD